MIWLTWRQFRTQAAVALAAVAATAIVLAITGPQIAHVYDTTVATCQANNDCPAATQAFLGTYHQLQGWLETLMYAVPGLIGIFWGAPLVARELESGTFRMAWTQGVTRTRWLITKLGIVGLASMVVAGALSLMVTWWSSRLDLVSMDRFATFDSRAIVPVGYAAFAFALGVTAGMLIRRSLPAMATTMVAFIAVRLAVTSWVRPHLFAPLHPAAPLDPASMGFFSSNGGPLTLVPNASIPNAWINSVKIVDGTGRELSSQVLKSICPTLGQSGPPSDPAIDHPQVAPRAVQQALHECVDKIGATYHQVVTYQPGTRYWGFQWYELAIFLAAAVLLGWLSVWLVRHRLT